MRRSGWLLGCAIAAAPGVARADSLIGSRGGVVERAAAVEMQMDRGEAILVVRRTFETRGDRDQQAELTIDRSNGAVVTGLRTLASNGTWVDGALMDASRAANRYEELTSFGLAAPRDPVLLWWSGDYLLTLQAFPVGPNAPRTVEYTMRVPVSWVGGRWTAWIPSMKTGDSPPTMVVRPASAHDALFIDGQPVAAPAHATLDHAVTVSLEPPIHSVVGGALAVVPLGRDRVLVRASVEAAGRLSEGPRGAWIVVLVDASRSVSAGALGAEKAAARAYLAWFRGAHVALVAFDREPHTLVPAFLDESDAIDALARAHIERRNGSHLDAALERASALLAQAPAGAVKRILALTDLRMRASLTPTGAAAIAARSGAVIHVVTAREGSPDLRSVDDDRWDAVPRASGGLLWEASAGDDPRTPAERVAFEGLARPKRIDRLSVALRGWGDSVMRRSLEEGDDAEEATIVSRAPDAIEVRGELWSRPVHAVLSASQAESRRWAVLSIGADVREELTPGELRAMATSAHAVSPVTSLLAVEPGARPSTAGLPLSVGGVGLGSFSTTSHCGGIGRGRRLEGFDGAAVLRAVLAPRWIACGGGGKRARVLVETTATEVVDVPWVLANGEPDVPLAACIREAAWSLDVPEEFASRSGTWQVDL